MIGTPMYGGNAKAVYVTSLIRLVSYLSAAGHEVVQNTMSNESLITRARNSIAHQFMSGDYDALLFIDSDHEFDPLDVVKMIQSGKDLIGAIYPMKSINWDAVRKAALLGKENLEDYAGFFAVNFASPTISFNPNEPFEVKDIGTGMMFITRKVFEDLAPHCKKYRNNAIKSSMNFGEEIIEYFPTFIDENGILLSEDYAFCRMWKDIGGQVWAAPWVKISHAGDYKYTGSFVQSILLSKEGEPNSPILDI